MGFRRFRRGARRAIDYTVAVPIEIVSFLPLSLNNLISERIGGRENWSVTEALAVAKAKEYAERTGGTLHEPGTMVNKGGIINAAFPHPTGLNEFSDMNHGYIVTDAEGRVKRHYRSVTAGIERDRQVIMFGRL